jgi:hypothetical protein
MANENPKGEQVKKPSPAKQSTPAEKPAQPITDRSTASAPPARSAIADTGEPLHLHSPADLRRLARKSRKPHPRSPHDLRRPARSSPGPRAPRCPSPRLRRPARPRLLPSPKRQQPHPRRARRRRVPRTPHHLRPKARPAAHRRGSRPRAKALADQVSGVPKGLPQREVVRPGAGGSAAKAVVQHPMARGAQPVPLARDVRVLAHR